MSKSHDEDKHRDKRLKQEEKFLEKVEQYSESTREFHNQDSQFQESYINEAIELLEEAPQYDCDTIQWVNDAICEFKVEVLKAAVSQNKSEVLKNLVTLFSDDELAQLGFSHLIPFASFSHYHTIENSGAAANSSSIPSAQDQEHLELAGNSNHEVDNQ